MANDSRGGETYFAASSKSRIGERLFEKLKKSMEANAELQELWSLAYGHYFPALEDAYGSTSRISRDGSKGQLALVRVAKNRRFAQAVCGIVLGANPDFEPRAINSGSNARAGVAVCRNILESMWQLKGMQRTVQRWVEQAFAFTESFIFAPWDDDAGEEAGVDEKSGLPVRTGDVKLRTVLPWDTARDPQVKNFEDSTWFGLRVWRNKWDLVARYPEDILKQPTKDKILGVDRDELAVSCSGVIPDFLGTGDLVPVWHWFHLPTAAVPAGREVIAVTPSCVLRDVPLRYDGFPAIRLTPAELFDTPFGYTAFLDGMGLQELSDGVDSALATNYLTCGVQALAVGMGTKQRTQDKLLNMEVIEVGQDGFVPQGINFTKNPPDAPKYREGIGKDHQQTFGLNDVYLGQPDTAQMNAQAFALLSSMAVQANNPFQRMFLEAVGALGTSIIRTYSKRVATKRLIPLLGKGDRHLLSSASFSGEDLKGIEQVFVRAGSALEQTIPGRVQLIDLFASHGVKLQPDQILDVIRTGKMEPLTHALQDELGLIQYENEQLLQGINPPVHTFHDHRRHCPEHATPVLNPTGLADAKVVEATQAHVDDHYIEYFGLPSPMAPDPMTGAMAPVVDPATGQPQKPNPREDPQFSVRIRMLLVQEPPPMAPMPPPGAPGAPPGSAGAGGPPPAHPQPGGGGEAPLSPPGSQGMTNGIELPTAPKNPLSGQGVAGGPGGLQ